MTIDERMGRLPEPMGKLTETMTRLGNIVIDHERRIEDIEDHKQ